MDRAFVDVFSWSSMVALLSPPATLLGIVVGVWAIRRAGWSTGFSKAITVILLSAVLLTIGGAVYFYVVLHHGPDPAAEQSIESLPESIRIMAK